MTWILLALAVLGIFTGFLAGLLGVGGGLILIPILTFMFHTGLNLESGLAVKMAIATGMSTIVVTSLASARMHHQLGAVRWDLVKGLAPGLVLGSLVASMWMFALINGAVLALVFSAFAAFSATQMLLDRKPTPSREMPGRLGQWAAGSFIGMFSGLVGAGGAFVSVPFMVWCNVPMRQVVATSAALGFPIALFNAMGYVISGWSVTDTPVMSTGYIWLPAFIVICISTVFTAPMGARMAHRWPVGKLKRLFALLLYALAGSMLYRGLNS
ncbi:MAG: sulfite exporter TauE/SafE family protein [Betaproteobacteria bacterium]|nr:sulfite exporter TauE/SafE family protein [Betaproteobacteria bacterium]